MVVHPIRLLVVCAPLSQVETARELGVDRVREPLDLLRGDVARQLVRRELRVVENLVCPRTSDARDHALVSQQRVQPPRLAGADLRESLGADADRFRPDVRKLVFRLLGRQQPDTRALLRSRLGEHQL